MFNESISNVIRMEFCDEFLYKEICMEKCLRFWCNEVDIDSEILIIGNKI